MRALFTLRNSLFAISGLGTALLLWYTAEFWLDAQVQRSDAERILQSTEIEDLLLAAEHDWASERGAAFAALNDPLTISPEARQAILEHRRQADQVFELALGSLREGPGWASFSDAVAEAETWLGEVQGLRERVDQQLGTGLPARDPAVAEAWFPSITELITASQRLRLATRYRARAPVREVEALKDLKHAVSVMSEFALRESALIAGTIAADDPLVLEDVEKLSAYRGHLEQAWVTALVYLRGEGTDSKVVGAIEAVRQGYFDTYQLIRAPIVLAGMEGAPFPVTADTWINQSGAAIRPILELGIEAGAASKRLAADGVAQGTRGLIIASVILVVALLIGGASLWIVTAWIVRPLERITRAMTALAGGDATVVLPSTGFRGEIGAMAEAIQVFKESEEQKTHEITKANRELQSLNEELDDRVRSRTAELSTARDEAIEASRAKSVFLANMSHELRTPLNAVIGFSDVLIDKVKIDGASPMLDPLQRIHGAGEHLLRLINDVLDIAKIEAGKMELSTETVSVPPLVQEAVTTARPMAEQNGNEIRLRCPEAVKPVKADPVRLRQIFLNLLSNAAKFTEHGTITVEITGQQGPEGDQILVAVTDTGIGIRQDQMEKLFAEFVQLDDASTRQHGGTGLGLAISQRLCTMMGGKITVVSEAGKGSTFTVHLAADAGAEARPALIPAETIDGAAVVQQVAPVRPARETLVLVIDDDPSARELLRTVLVREGYRVVVAAGGKEGLRLAKDLKPAVITLDILMPELDGWSVLTALKADAELADIPVVMVTILDEASQGYALGATDFLIKPVEQVRLLSTLSRNVRSHDQLSVLLVEDDAKARSYMRGVLEDDGCLVFEAANRKEALAALESALPDLIVLDLITPDIEGFDFLSALQSDRSWRAIPVVGVTTDHLSDEEHARLDGEVDRVVRKNGMTGTQLREEILERISASLRIGAEGNSANAKTILYVEDNEDNIVLLKTRLEEKGYEVMIARDGETGVDMARNGTPALILMDMSLPVMDGWTATNLLKSSTETRDIPVIGISAHAMVGDREKALAIGCDDYITKPVDMPGLLSKLDAILG